jgi:predicted acylesterase/phospholipase RssA
MLKQPNRYGLIVIVAAMAVLAGCTTVPPRHPAPEALEDSVEVLGMHDARFWGDDIPPNLETRLLELTDDQQIKALYPASYGSTHNYLALSGGGANGAYGAGMLAGWTDAGDRPQFQMVSGISTGALTAPWAFLGPAYDPVLREIYTTMTTSDILQFRPWYDIPFSASAADSAPLLKLIEHYMNDEIIEAIAAEHRKGRRLFIGTTDLDYMRPRIWNIGAIAASGKPGAKQLIEQIMLASASIPGVFPPVLIQVDAAGQSYDELHVDGGVTHQVFVYPAQVNWAKVMERLRMHGQARMFVIRNAVPGTKRETVEQKIGAITGRSISSLIRTQGIGDMYQIFTLTKRDGIDYNLAYIPSDFEATPKELFDKDYMNKLFELGYRKALAGYPWDKKPPGWIVRDIGGR